MTYIHTLPSDVVLTLLKASGVMWLIIKPTGEIVDASQEFLRWAGYTHEELCKVTWMHISVPDDSLMADMNAVHELNPYHPFYVVRKQYIPKNEKPVWGELSVTRHPMVGETIECCFCTWNPMKNGSAQAMAVAMEHCNLMIGRMQSLESEVSKLTLQTDEDRFWLSLMDMIRKHPRVIAGCVFIALSIFGANNIVELLQRVGFIRLPDKVQIQQHDQQSSGRNSLAYFL